LFGLGVLHGVLHWVLAAEAQFDSKAAERDLRRYRRRGADVTTRLLLKEIRRWPLAGRRLLDVGGGPSLQALVQLHPDWPADDVWLRPGLEIAFAIPHLHQRGVDYRIEP
jgi:hypothetical protein